MFCSFKPIYLFIWALFFLPSVAFAQLELSLGLGSSDFDYEEFDQTGDFLDGDSGSLNYFLFALGWTEDSWSFRTEYSQKASRIDYRSVLIDSRVDTDLSLIHI